SFPFWIFLISFFFFYNVPSTPYIYTLSLHDALPIFPIIVLAQYLSAVFILSPEKNAVLVLLDLNLFLIVLASSLTIASGYIINRSEEHTSELQSRRDLVCRLLLEKKN